MRTLIILIFAFSLTSLVLHSQRTVSQIEGYLEVYLPEDLTSLYVGKTVARLVDGSTQRFNTYVGSEAGAGTLTGRENSFFGRQAGFFTTSGSDNSFFGKSSGYLNTTGADNAFFGSEAGYSNTTGRYNSFFGRNSGYANTTGRRNSFFGNFAGFSNTTGTENAFFGDFAGDSNTTGLNNTFLGTWSGDLNTTGSRNSFIGYRAGAKITEGDLNVCLGNNAGPTSEQSNRLYIDVKETNAPLIYGEFDNDLVTINGTLRLGPTNHFSGFDDGLIISPSPAGSDLFLQANDAVIVEIGGVAAQTGTFEVWEATTNNPIMELDESGNLEIQGTLSQGSDINRKEAIVPVNYEDVLTKVKDLQIAEWQYNGEDIRHIGPMAQDFYKAFGLGQGETTITSVDADGVALAAIKALAQENQELEKELENTEQHMETLEDRIKVLEELVFSSKK